MSLAEYFENARGLGVLGTADSDGKVDLAVYARPHVIDESTVAFIMSGRLSHQNLTSNPHAAYLFREQTDAYVGKRLYLTKIREETDPQLVEAIRRRHPKAPHESDLDKYVVHFRVEKVRALVGD